MSQDPKAVVRLLTACMGLPLFPNEVALLRSMIHAWGMGQQRAWGAANDHLADDVEALFLKCQAMLGMAEGVQCSTPSATA